MNFDKEEKMSVWSKITSKQILFPWDSLIESTKIILPCLKNIGNSKIREVNSYKIKGQ